MAIQALVYVFLLVPLYVVSSGLFAAVAPDKWIQAKWTPRGRLTKEDLETTWQRIQLRLMGLTSALIGGVFVTGMLDLPFKNLIVGLAGLLFFGTFAASCIATLIWPEQNMPSAYRRQPTESGAPRRFLLIAIRLFALFLVVFVIAAVILRIR